MEYRERFKQEIEAYCTRDRTETTWRLIRYVESTEGDSKEYECNSCGEIKTTGLEGDLEELKEPFNGPS